MVAVEGVLISSACGRLALVKALLSLWNSRKARDVEV